MAIDIADKPRIVSPPDRFGSALEIPLTEEPSADWLSHFDLPVDKAELDELILRIWLTPRVRSNLQALLDQVKASIEQANQALADAEERRRVLAQRASQQAREDRARIENDLDSWWARVRASRTASN